MKVQDTRSVREQALHDKPFALISRDGSSVLGAYTLLNLNACAFRKRRIITQSIAQFKPHGTPYNHRLLLYTTLVSLHSCQRQAFAGVDDFVTLPGSPDPLNPVRYKQIAGAPVSFDADTGERTASDVESGAVFVLTEGLYFCMVAESNSEAALFDAPEGRAANNAMTAGLRHARKRIVARFSFNQTRPTYISRMMFNFSPSRLYMY